MLILVTNPVDEIVKIEGEYIATSKKDKENHGFGMKNIFDIIEKYNGIRMIECKEREFKFFIIIQRR